MPASAFASTPLQRKSCCVLGPATSHGPCSYTFSPVHYQRWQPLVQRHLVEKIGTVSQFLLATMVKRRRQGTRAFRSFTLLHTHGRGRISHSEGIRESKTQGGDGGGTRTRFPTTLTSINASFARLHPFQIPLSSLGQS